MKTFKVCAKEIHHRFVTVNANNKEEAYSLAVEIPTNEWDVDYEGDETNNTWETYDCEEVKQKTYRVYARYTVNCQIDVRAINEEDAYEKAEEIPMDEWCPKEEYYEPEPDYYDCEEV